MDAALKGLTSTVKHSATKEAVNQAKDSVKSFHEHKDVPVVHVREKCFSAFELALDNGNEKSQQFAIDGIQVILRDQKYHDSGTEDRENHLATQLLYSMTGIDEWKDQLQCKCITLLVEMICSNELKISLTHVEECVQIYKRLYSKSDEERVRVSCRAATTQSLAAYFSNRLSTCEGAQDSISVYLDVCKLLEELCGDIEQMSSSHEQCLISLDAMCAILSTCNVQIVSHQPFANLLWEKLCPLIILMLGIPGATSGSSNGASQNSDEPVGEGQIDFALAPAIVTNPDTWRILYQIVDQLIRLMISEPQLNSSTEALFHKAFMFPRIDQRGEALKLIRKMTSDGSKLSKLARSCMSTKSLSLWRMLITSVCECSNPRFELSVDAVRTIIGMLDGMKQLSSHRYFTAAEKQLILDMFPTDSDAIMKNFVEHECSSLSERVVDDDKENDTDDEMAEKLRKLEEKFGHATAARISEKPRRSSEFDESSEKSTAKKFVESLQNWIEKVSELKSTLAVDEEILQFSSEFYTKFCSVHADAYKSRSKIQQEFLNTDAIYLTTYASLCFATRPDTFDITEFKKVVLSSNSVIHVSIGWLEKVYECLQSCAVLRKSNSFSLVLLDVLNDFDGHKLCLLSDVEKLKNIDVRAEKESTQDVLEERRIARWMLSSAWQSVVDVLSTFLDARNKGKVREKIRDAVTLSISGMRSFAGVAKIVGLQSRCGWIFEQLVETSCCLEDLRSDASSDGDQKSTCTSRDQLLAMQLVLDEARIAVHDPSCWKHIVRCTEYVWELEKYIYGALCYEKPSRLKFLRRKTEEKEENDTNCSEMVAEATIEHALGDEPTLSIHSLNRAICVLITKVDQFYTNVCKELCLPALRHLCIAIVSSSENRIFYASHNSSLLTSSVLLLNRISDVISTLSHRPMIHQMFIWPLVADHFVKVCQCDKESRMAANALSEVAARLLVVESPGLCYNQTLLVPFQTASCSEACSDETKEQLLCSLSSLVLSQTDKIGSGWKPLFGSLKAVIACNAEKVHWCTIDVISSYLSASKPNVISSSLLECVPCVINLLQNCTDDQNEVALATLRLLPSIYSSIVYLYKKQHSPSYHVLHRNDLRSKCLDFVDIGAIDPLEVPHGPLPWIDKQTHEVASIELFLSFMEQICGTLLTSSQSMQKNLLDIMNHFLIDISETELGSSTGGVCMSAVVLPFVHKWMRRNDVQETRILKQVIGSCTQTVLEMIGKPSMSCWKSRLLRDICALFVECVQHEKTCATAPAYFTLIANSAESFDEEHWSIYTNLLATASAISIRHLKLINSYFVRGSHDENGDIGSVTAYHPRKLQFQQLLAAIQVFSSKRARRIDDQLDCDGSETIESGIAQLMLSHERDTYRLYMSSIINQLLTNCLLLQHVASLLISGEELTSPQLKESLIGSSPPLSYQKFNDTTYRTLYSILDSSSETAIEFDLRPAIGGLFSKMVGIENANLLKIIVSSNLIASLSYLRRFNDTKDEDLLDQLAKRIEANSSVLHDVELEVCRRRSAIASREHAISTYHLIPVKDDVDEGAYKLVSQDYVDKTLQEYEQHRDRLKASTRSNPFQSDTVPNQESVDDNDDFDEIRLAAYRDICIIPLRIACDTFEPNIVKKLIPAMNRVIMASPDMSVRRLATDFLKKCT